MAPEQAAGDPATDQRADIYAWALLAQELLTGRTPPGPAARRAEPPGAILGAARRGVPARLIRLIDDCLSTDPARRVGSMGEVLSTLNQLVVPGGTRRGRARLGRWAVGVAGAGTVAALALAVWPGSAADLPLPVAVAVFVNETGDSSLSPWGRFAGDWITQGLQETGRVSVVPWPAAAQASDLIEGESAGRGNLVRRMREETGAGTIVTGSLYAMGDSIRFQVQVANAVTGRLLGALAPVTVHRSAPQAAVRELRARLMGQMAVWSDERLAAVPGLAERPPTFEAYQVFDHGLQLYNDQQYRAAAAEFRRAHELDTAFVVARVYEAITCWNTGLEARLDSVLAALLPRRAGLSDYHALQLRTIEALTRGDRAAALAAERRAVEIAPGSKAAYNLAQVALDLNRPAEALAALATLDPDRGAMRGWSSYWTVLTHAHHLSGDHGRELDAARQLRRRYPDRRVGTVLEARALAAARRIPELDSLVTSLMLLPPRTYWSQGAALVVAGEELLAHHDSGLARPYFERARDWLVARRAADPDYGAYREFLAGALYGLRQWDQAAATLAPAVADTSERYSLRALGILAGFRARGGSPPALPDVGPRDAAERAFYAARIAAVAGDLDAGFEWLTEAMRLGVDGFAWAHGSAHHDLALLSGDPRFQRIMAARP
jgi:tetratricopeptide (TPR) repeat protein